MIGSKKHPNSLVANPWHHNVEDLVVFGYTVSLQPLSFEVKSWYLKMGA